MLSLRRIKLGFEIDVKGALLGLVQSLFFFPPTREMPSCHFEPQCCLDVFLSFSWKDFLEILLLKI